MMCRLISALILAGGKATRFGGIAKHEIVVEGETIFARQVRVLAPRVAEILVSGAEVPGYRTVRDPIEDAGPLAGIAAGLAACKTDWLLVVAGDMPFITAGLVQRLIDDAIRSQDPRGGDCAEGVGIRLNGLPEPLVCILHKRVLPAVARRLAAGDYKVSRLLTDELWVTWIDDADAGALRNLNSPEDLAGITGSK
jgi:molybdopterin-guanine dinucleotide biosynthesis protein A